MSTEGIKAFARQPGISGSTAAAPSPTSSAARRTARCVAHKLLSENPEAYRDAAVQGIRDLLGLEARRADPAGPHRRGEDGHHGRDQCAARAQGRAHAARHHQRFPRRAAHRLPGAAENLRQAHHQARHAVRARGRGRRARARRRHGRARARSRRRAARARSARRPTASTRSRSCSCTPIAIPSTSAQVAALAREMGFPQVSVSHEVSPLIKLVGRGDTTVVDAYLSPILRRYVATVAQEMGVARDSSASPSPGGGGSDAKRPGWGERKREDHPLPPRCARRPPPSRGGERRQSDSASCS